MLKTAKTNKQQQQQQQKTTKKNRKVKRHSSKSINSRQRLKFFTQLLSRLCRELLVFKQALTRKHTLPLIKFGDFALLHPFTNSYS